MIVRLRSQALAVLGLAALGIVAVQLLTDRLTIPEAALRIGVVLVVLLGVERVLFPIARSLVGPVKEQPTDPGGGSSTGSPRRPASPSPTTT